MLEKPNIADDTIVSCLRENYGLRVEELTFLPIGNDVNTAVYRVTAPGARYFLKLRSGEFDDAVVSVPHFLHGLGIPQIIPPILTITGGLWARLNPFAVSLFPYVPGGNGFESPLTERQWLELGAALRSVHSADIPTSLAVSIPREEYSPRWRDMVRTIQDGLDVVETTDAVSAEMVAFLRAEAAVIHHVVRRAETLADILRNESREFVLCHADIHAANVLIDSYGSLYVIDWDTLTFAPKERDLMFIGAGIGGAWNDRREEAWFYKGYGTTKIDPVALVYYRYERFVEDVAEYSTRLLFTQDGGADRATGLRKFNSAFQPGDVVDIATRTDERLLS